MKDVKACGITRAIFKCYDYVVNLGSFEAEFQKKISCLLKLLFEPKTSLGSFIEKIYVFVTNSPIESHRNQLRRVSFSDPTINYAVTCQNNRFSGYFTQLGP